MKFPVVFRVFAALDIIGFILLLIQTVFLYNFPAMGVWMIATSAFATIWFLITSFVWFFGSKKSYPFLYLSALMLWLLAGFTVYSGARMPGSDADKGFIVLLFYAAICVIYSLFHIVAMFFGPVKKWCAEQGVKKLDLVPVISFALIGAICFITLHVVNKRGSQFIVMDEGYISQVLTNNIVTVNYNHLTEFNGLIISKDDQTEEVKALVYFANNYDAKDPGDFFQVDTIVFKKLAADAMRTGEYLPTIGPLNSVQLVAEFEPVKAKRIMVVDLSNANMSAHQYAFSPVNRVDRFIPRVDREQFLTYDNVSKPTDQAVEYTDVDYAAMEAEEEKLLHADLDAATSLTSGETHELIDGFLDEIVNKYENSQYQFTDNHSIYLREKGFGTYVNFRSLFENYADVPLNSLAARKTEDGQELSLNNAIWVISGLNMYRENEDLPFKSLNPAFLVWAEHNLLPNPDEEFMGHTSQEIYNNMFRRTMWLLAAAYEQVALSDSYQEKADAYYQAMNGSSEFYGPTYLYELYGKKDPDSWFSKVYSEFPQKDNEYFYFDESTAVGFWLRRKLDGTDKQAYEFLSRILAKYDNYAWG